MEIITLCFIGAAIVVMLGIIVSRMSDLIAAIIAFAEANMKRTEIIQTTNPKDNQKEPKKTVQPIKEPKPKRESVYGEEWKPLVEPVPYRRERIQVERYEISNMGRVWDKKTNRYIKPFMEVGVLKVRLTTHRSCTKRNLGVLVASAFIGKQNTSIYGVVNCDGNIKNCAATNLRWEKKDIGRKQITEWGSK